MCRERLSFLRKGKNCTWNVTSDFRDTGCNLLCVRSMGKGEPGDGAGVGGGSGGTIREAGGAFGKREAAQEEQYFRKLEQEQMRKLKDLQSSQGKEKKPK
ncbi:ATPase inhibitor mai-2, mitochondrial-like isoform X3 [Penaeus indicus]|uniref:ATPase inhibitor mai-2, mitochondrial-like isoform X3 n=1 Tax=Penaeus indicus TaxID=29960 RepID=UPI00300C3A04